MGPSSCIFVIVWASTAEIIIGRSNITIMNSIVVEVWGLVIWGGRRVVDVRGMGGSSSIVVVVAMP